MNAPSLRPHAVLALLFAAVLMATYFVYRPGISGPFLLDDHVHLPRLANYGGVTSLENLLRFAFETHPGSGRPLAYLSFALNDQYWPAPAESFKYTNILLHLLNAVLVFLLARSLFALAVTERRHADFLALLVMALWALHPLQQSTVLYVIQRMTELSALFVLCGALVYLQGRRRLHDRPLAAFALMSLGVGGCGVLAVLSKETGILLVLFVLVIEGTLLQANGGIYRVPPRFRVHWRLWKTIFLVLPMLALILYIAAIWGDAQSAWDRRPFTLAERLLTQARAVSSYLLHIFVPRLHGLGIFHDHYAISRGLLAPPSTFFSVVFLGLLLAAALWLRRRSPAVSFAILWFFAGHLLEGTVLPLELYFEHRNYLPILGPLFGLCYLGYRLAQRHPRLRNPLTAAAALYVLTLGSLTFYNASIWGEKGKLLSISAAEHPRSVRAGLELAGYRLKRGEIGKALEELERLRHLYPRDASLDLSMLYYGCLANKASEKPVDLAPLVESAVEKLPTSSAEYGSIIAVKAMRETIVAGKCVGIDLRQLTRLQAALQSNPTKMNDRRSRSVLFKERAQTYAMLGNLNDAMAYMDKAYDVLPQPDYRLLQAVWLYDAGLVEEGRRFLDLARQTPPVSRWIAIGNEERIDRLARALENGVSADGPSATPR
jgi:tetratricopeptide (TPR) repeat protein